MAAALEAVHVAVVLEEVREAALAAAAEDLQVEEDLDLEVAPDRGLEDQDLDLEVPDRAFITDLMADFTDVRFGEDVITAEAVV